MLKSADPNTSTKEIRTAFINATDHELSGQNVEPSDLQIDFAHDQWWVTHKPSGAQWSVNDAEPGDFCFEQVTEGDLEDWLDENHEHVYGPVEHARITGNPHRKCQHPGCRQVSLDLDDDDCEEDDEE